MFGSILHLRLRMGLGLVSVALGPEFEMGHGGWGQEDVVSTCPLATTHAQAFTDSTIGYPEGSSSMLSPAAATGLSTIQATNESSSRKGASVSESWDLG